MWRNREWQLFMVVLMIIGLLIVGAATFFLTAEALIYILATEVLLITAFLLFTRWRYREIEKLTDYMRKISSESIAYDIRDNYEGELSILKNEIYKVTRKLSDQSNYLQKNKQELTDAISDISHQLKTPLTSMMVMSDLLNDSNLDVKKRSEFTRSMTVQLERIDWLVSSLLKLSKIDAGTIQFKQDPVNAADAIRKATQPVLIPMDVKNQTFELTGDVTATFIGDANWTAEALLNILKNCVEHTGEGGRITASCSENALFTEIIITDNGRGIPKEDLPYIFKRFYKGKNAGDDSIGIGLAMAYSIIKRQNGSITVKSELNQGTTFHIKLYKQIL
ncbi:sensor histidine kinase [Cytobacillus gottheilii]|uniref:histidine kinase n=1 Tax=Cytobacillus gottheilii TaxID=859144 RepID=A0ABX8FHF3_9BACI|nr:HAMP domain-containing sensor histidine kinase [Cytobacillus gottheilii]QVY63431.1 HAMP domain-containing histidine kinase [Cytobacillus gottheilii]